MISNIRKTSYILRNNGIWRYTPNIMFSASAAPAVNIDEPVQSPPVKKPTTGFDMTPKEVVNFLDEHIVGQGDAKRAVAVAFRNRWRRQRLPIEIKNEVESVFTVVFYHGVLI